MAKLHAILRRRSWLGGVLVLLCVVTLAAEPATASVPARFRVTPKKPLPVPGAFRLSASNGYTLYVVGIPSRGALPGSLRIFAFAKGKSVTYKAPATVTETSIQADLGVLGRIDVAFHRSDRATTVLCDQEPIRFDSGNYEGTIDFFGEEGYTAVETTTVPGNIDFWLGVLCGDEVFFDGGSGRWRGASLDVRNPALGQEMSVSKRRPGASAQISAWTSEYSSGVSISRFTTLRMPGEDFTYDRRLRTATVRPPAPFAGSARFDLGRKAGQRWSGDLTVDLPGRADVPLTGPSLRATLTPSG